MTARPVPIDESSRTPHYLSNKEFLLASLGFFLHAPLLSFESLS